MKKFLLKLSLFIPIMAGVMAINYAGDSASLFQSREVERGITRTILAGNNVTDLRRVNFDERFLQKFCIEGFTESRDVVVLGSSQTMVIHAEHFPRKTFFNNSMSGGALQDYIALYGLYRERRILPATVMLALDPWVFNPLNELNSWETLKDSYNKTMAYMSRYLIRIPYRLTHFVPQRYLEIVSPSYFQASIQHTQKYGWDSSKKLNTEMFRITKERLNDETTILADGSRVWDKRTRTIAETGITQNMPGFGDPAWRLTSFKKLDETLTQSFLDFITLMKRDGVNIIIFIPPYHPQAYDALIHNPEFVMFGETEKFLKETAAREEIEVIGSYNPYVFDLQDGKGFHDRYHFDETVIQKIFDKSDLNNLLHTKNTMRRDTTYDRTKK